MDQNEWLAACFEEHRPHLRAIAYRMLSSLAEAEDAVQDAWLRVTRARTEEVENVGGWLTTIVARVCLNMLRARNVRREDSLDTHVPDAIIRIPALQLGPEDEALMADSVGLALLIVLDNLTPAERLAFVLHDMFDLPFEEIAPMVGRTPTAARQLASRARRRVKGADLPTPERNRSRQREVVDAFFTAARGGNFGALIALLDSDVVLRIDAGGGVPITSTVMRGAQDVARHASGRLRSWLEHRAIRLHSVLVNGAAGVLVTSGGRPAGVMAFTVADGKIVEIDSIADPERLALMVNVA